MVDTRASVRVFNEGRGRQGGVPTHGLRMDMLKQAVPTSPPPLAFRTTPHSPSADSDETEFFDAHEEIPWTPEGPTRRSPSVMVVRMPRDNSRIYNGLAYPTPTRGDAAASSQPNPEQEKLGEKLNRATSLRSLFPSKESMLKLEDWRSISVSRLQVKPRLEQELDPDFAEPAATGPSANAVDGHSMRLDIVDDLVTHGEDMSTASGTTVTEGGWDSSGNGLEEVGDPVQGVSVASGRKTDKAGKEKNGIKMAAPAMNAAVSPIKNSLLWVLENARSRTRQRQAKTKLKKGAGKRRPDGDPNGVTNEIDSSVTSTDGIPALEETGDAVAETFAGGQDARMESYFLRRRTKTVAKSEATNGPPEIKMHRHGRGAGKVDGWRSTYMVQCLRHHKGPVWTLEFNRHGTRMATGGEDGKVVVWNIAVSADATKDSTEDERMKGDTERKNEAKSGAQPCQADEDAGYVADSERRPGTAVNTDGVAPRDLPTESLSPASGVSDEAASLGRGSSDLGHSGGSENGSNSTALEVFGSTPARVFRGHESDVVDLSWSHSDFLCSASIDHKVMLWHPLRGERLGTFTHPDFVTSVQFHPLDDHVFLTGCFDKRLRLWTVTNGRVVDWVQCQDMISSARFTPDGQLAVAGLYDGRVIFHHTTGLRYYTQIHCRNRYGTNRRGKKVTGLAFIETSLLHNVGCHPCGGVDPSANDQTGGAGEGLGEARGKTASGTRKGLEIGMGKANNMSAQYSLLSTTNDSRLRIYDLDNFTMSSKFKGLANDGIQIKASFSEDGMFVVSGSEDGQVYLWNSSRQQTNAVSTGGAPNDRFNGGSGGGSSAVPSCSTVTVAASDAGATSTSGRFKSRISSSFSVQCSTRPKVATVATFLPTSAFDAVLGSGDIISNDSPDRLLRGEGAKGTERRPQVTRPSSYRRVPSMPLSRGTDGPRRRRWTFGGHARFRGESGESYGDKVLFTGKTKSGPTPLSQPVVRAQTRALNKGRLPDASSTSRSSLDSRGKPTALDEESQVRSQAMKPLAEAPASEAKLLEEWRKSGRLSVGSKIRGIVSADYSGDVKVFLGFVDELDGAGS